MKEFLMKKFGGLPVWAWALVGVAGIGTGYLLIRYQQKKSGTNSALTTQNSADLTTGNASGNESSPASGQVGNNGVIDNPFPEATVNGQQIPIVPPGYQAVYDPNGNIVGWEPLPPNPVPGPPNVPPGTGTGANPGLPIPTNPVTGSGGSGPGTGANPGLPIPTNPVTGSGGSGGGTGANPGLPRPSISRHRIASR